MAWWAWLAVGMVAGPVVLAGGAWLYLLWRGPMGFG